MSRSSSRASSEGETGGGMQHESSSAPPPRPDQETLNDDSDDEFKDQSTANNENGPSSSSSSGQVNNNNDASSASADALPSSFPSSSKQHQDPAAGINDGEDKNDEDDEGTPASPKETSGSYPVYTEAEMERLRQVAKELPLLTVAFHKFMRGISISVASAPGQTPTSATTPATPMGVLPPPNWRNSNQSGASASGSGGGTPFTPVPTGSAFPPAGGKFGSGGGAGGGGGGGGFATLDRNAFKDVNISQAAIRERTLLHKIRGIFAKVSDENFEQVKADLCALPIRQSEDGEVREIVHWIYDKAVQPEDEIYVRLYANLIEALTKDISQRDPKKANAVRKALIEKCQQSFDRRIEVADAAKHGTGSTAGAAETKVESRDSAASAHIKNVIQADDDPEYIRNREKTRLRANIKFLAQLFRVSMVNPRVVNYVLYSLLYGTENSGRHKPQEYEIEMFCDLIKSVHNLLPADIKDQYLSKYLETVKEHSTNTKTSIRVRCLLQDLLDLSENGWLTREERRRKGIPLSNNNNVAAGGVSVSVTVPVPSSQQQLQQQQHGRGNPPPFQPPAPVSSRDKNNSGSGAPPYGSPSSPYPPAYRPNAIAGGGGGNNNNNLAGSNTNLAGGSINSRLPPATMAPHHPVPTKENVLGVIDRYRETNEPRVLLEHFALLHGEELKLDHLVHWVMRAVRAVKRSDERKMVGYVIDALSHARQLPPHAGMLAMWKLAPLLALEYEDIPKLFSSWAEMVPFAAGSGAAASSAAGAQQTALHPCACNPLLRELIKQRVPFEIIERMLFDTIRGPSAPAAWQPQNPTDVPMGRFRLLPAVLSCTRDSGGDDEDDLGGDGGAGGMEVSSSSMSGTAGGGGSAAMERSGMGGSSMSGSAAAAAAAADDAAPPLRRDLLGYLLLDEELGRPRTDTPFAAEIELDMFGIFSNTDLPLLVNMNQAFKRVRGHPQRNDPVFVSGVVCAICCFLRIAAVTGERQHEFEKIRDILKELKIPGDNTTLFIREAYLTYCELDARPTGWFQKLLQWLLMPPNSLQQQQQQMNNSNNKDYQSALATFNAEWNAFERWRKTFNHWISATVDPVGSREKRPLPPG